MAKFSTLGYTDETIREMRQKANFCEFNPQTGDYTLTTDDWGKWLKVTSGSDVDITVPVDIFPVGGAVPIIRMGAGAVTVVPGSGVTINSDGEDNAIPSQYKTALLIQVSSNTWLLQGIGATGSSSGGGEGSTQLSTPTLTATVASSSQINLSWSNVANESSYALYWSPNGSSGWTQIGGTIAANTTSYNHTGLTGSTHYYYRVKAVGDGVTYTDSNYGTDDATTTIFSDDFNRADSALTLGGSWATQGGAVWGISSNKAYCIDANSGTAAFRIAYVDTAVADAALAVDLFFAASQTQVAVIFRYADVNNYLFLNVSRATGFDITALYKVVSGVQTALVTNSAIAAAGSSSTFTIVYSGTSIEAFRDGVSILTYSTSTGLEANTKVGLGSYRGAGIPSLQDDLDTRFDNLLVT